jgi:hypothetical protein
MLLVTTFAGKAGRILDEPDLAEPVFGDLGTYLT